MNIIKILSSKQKILVIVKLLVVSMILTGCGVNYQISTLNSTNPSNVVVIQNEQQLRNKLRTDFNFRYDFAQYALRQPPSFDWRFHRFNRGYNQYSIFGTNTWGYGSYWNRDQMWMDWVWGYPFGNGMGWSYSWNNQRWSSNQWGWNNPYGWNNYYGWGNGYGWNNGVYNRYRVPNVAYHNGTRTSVTNSRIPNRKVIRTNTDVPSIRANTRVMEVRNSEDRVIRPTRTQTIFTPVRTNTIPPVRTNTRPIIRNNNTQPTRIKNSQPVRKTQQVISKGRGNQ